MYCVCRAVAMDDGVLQREEDVRRLASPPLPTLPTVVPAGLDVWRLIIGRRVIIFFIFYKSFAILLILNSKVIFL